MGRARDGDADGANEGGGLGKADGCGDDVMAWKSSRILGRSCVWKYASPWKIEKSHRKNDENSGIKNPISG